MSIRTTNTAVRSVIPTGLTDDEIDALIVQSNTIVNRTLVNKGLAEDLLKDIETWLTAHLIATGKEIQPISEKVGDVSVQYSAVGGKRDKGGFLEETTYGRMVLFLDTSGGFQKSSMKRASIKAVKQNSDPMGTSDY